MLWVLLAVGCLTYRYPAPIESLDVPLDGATVRVEFAPGREMTPRFGVLREGQDPAWCDVRGPRYFESTFFDDRAEFLRRLAAGIQHFPSADWSYATTSNHGCNLTASTRGGEAVLRIEPWAAGCRVRRGPKRCADPEDVIELPVTVEQIRELDAAFGWAADEVRKIPPRHR